MVGLRGVGKTVLLDRISEDAEANRVLALRIEAPEQRSLAFHDSASVTVCTDKALTPRSRKGTCSKRAESIGGFRQRTESEISGH